MIAKGISQDDFSDNGVGRRSNRSFRMRTMTVSGSSPTHSPRRVVPYFYPYFLPLGMVEESTFISALNDWEIEEMASFLQTLHDQIF